MADNNNDEIMKAVCVSERITSRPHLSRSDSTSSPTSGAKAPLTAVLLAGLSFYQLHSSGDDLVTSLKSIRRCRQPLLQP